MEEKEITKEVMETLKNIFYQKAQNADVVIENEGHDGFYTMSKETGDKLKRLLIKYKFK